MSPALSGFISLFTRGGDGYTHALKEARSKGGTRWVIAPCGVTESDRLVVYVPTFAASANASICRACVQAIEAEQRRKHRHDYSDGDVCSGCDMLHTME